MQRRQARGCKGRVTWYNHHVAERIELTDEEREILERAREITGRLRRAPKTEAHKAAISRAVQAFWDSPAGQEERKLRSEAARAVRIMRRERRRVRPPSEA